MLLVLIPIAWFALLVLFAAICRVAAEGEAGPAAHPGAGAISIGERITLSPLSERRLTPSRGGRLHRAGSLRHARGRRRAHGVR